MLLTVGLFAISSTPKAGYAFPGVMHWVAHLAAYALIAFAFGLGWPKRPMVHIAILVAAIGVIHEMTEIITHSHAFEIEDAIVNAIGALVGVAIQRTAQRAVTR
jgi:VanZ family protein